MTQNIWILVANSAIAKIYRASNNNVLEEIQQLTHPESRLHVRDLVTDRQGRGFESATNGRHPMEPTTSPKETEFINFARDISLHLTNAHNEGKFGKLYIIAAPHFLGLLRDLLKPNMAPLLAGEIDKDITQYDTKKIREHLPEVL